MVKNVKQKNSNHSNTGLPREKTEITVEKTKFGFLIHSADCENKRPYLKRSFYQYYSIPENVKINYKK